MTEGIYYEEPYKKELDAVVVDVKDNKVILDKTIFYSHSAGEPADTGYIGNFRVIEVLKENGDIVHIMEEKPNLKKRQEVKCKIDWERRYKLMKMHTALHLLFNVCQIILDPKIRVTGSNVDVHKSRMDLDYESIIDSEKRQELEDKCNESIKQNLEMKIWWDSQKIGYRWTQIGDFDKMPCGGLHIKTLGEIKNFKIVRRTSKGKGRQRLEIDIN